MQCCPLCLVLCGPPLLGLALFKTNGSYRQVLVKLRHCHSQWSPMLRMVVLLRLVVAFVLLQATTTTTTAFLHQQLMAWSGGRWTSLTT